MSGLIATIIAIYKKRTVLAWICGIWTIVGLYEIAYGNYDASVPGWLFVIILLFLKNKRKEQEQYEKTQKQNVIVNNIYIDSNDNTRNISKHRSNTAQRRIATQAIDNNTDIITYTDVYSDEGYNEPEVITYPNEYACEYCGEVIPASSRFCSNCGAKCHH